METKKHYVYELINLYGTVEYVGETIKPERRFIDHTKYKYENGNNGFGKFYKRQDIFMNIVKSFDNRKDALDLEGKLKTTYGIEWIEKIRGKIRGNENVKNGHLIIARQKSLEKLNKPILQFTTNGEFIKKWDSATIASKKLNISKSSLSLCCNGKNKSAGGFVWKYEKN
jgi:predicted GIY-YIG superfamily endonuclease